MYIAPTKAPLSDTADHLLDLVAIGAAVTDDDLAAILEADHDVGAAVAATDSPAGTAGSTEAAGTHAATPPFGAADPSVDGSWTMLEC